MNNYVLFTRLLQEFILILLKDVKNAKFEWHFVWMIILVQWFLVDLCNIPCLVLNLRFLFPITSVICYRPFGRSFEQDYFSILLLCGLNCRYMVWNDSHMKQLKSQLCKNSCMVHQISYFIHRKLHRRLKEICLPWRKLMCTSPTKTTKMIVAVVLCSLCWR